MMNEENIISGCGNYNCFTGVCNTMFEKGAGQPSFAKKALIDPPGAIEGPPSPGIEGLVCTALHNPGLQKECSNFVTRIIADNLRDENI